MYFSSLPVRILFFRDARTVYGENGLTPATEQSAGIDLRACIDAAVTLAPGEREKIPTGLAVEPTLPGFAGFVYSRSGLGAKKGVVVAQGVGVIDPDYRGEILVFLLNTGQEAYTVTPGERIAQIIFQPFVRPLFQPVSALGETGRGAGGFGSTGRHQ